MSTRGRTDWTLFRRAGGGSWLFRGTDWRVDHCGHPTAIRPYYGVGPGGELMLSRGINDGVGFSHLVDAQQAVELHLARVPPAAYVILYEDEILARAAVAPDKRCTPCACGHHAQCNRRDFRGRCCCLQEGRG